MSGPNLCPMCQSTLPPSAPEGLCPKCLWASLLTADANAEQELLESPLVPFPHGKRPDIPDILGDYELLSEIARGGMGVVYRARQISLQRVVALKMISTPRLPGEAEMQRFRAEAEAVARLEHPNIVPIYEVGEEDGRAYFTMKFVAGGSLADQLAQLRSSTNPPDAEQSYTSAKEISGFPSESAATLIAKIARAVHHAHRYGILHRDLKSSNILLDERGEPLVTDFGLAKQLETESHLTLSGAVLGTPAYIAPEQAVGGKSLTTAADVYSLGAILYELLTGRPPFQADTPLATLRQVVDLDPVRPSAINPDLDRQLEAICLSCLHKNPTQRYSSAEALADDLERWLRHEPILAQPSTWTDRIGKWSRRHPARAALITLGILAPAIIIGVLWDAERKLRRERNNAVDQEAKARVSARHAETAAGQANLLRAQTRQSLYAADMLLAQHALDEGNLNLARRLVASYRPSSVNHAGATNAPDLRGFEWRVLWERCQGDKHETLLGHFNPVYSVAFSPDSQWLASGDAQGKVKLWEMASRRPFATLELSNKAVVQITFSADGKSLSASDESGRAVVWNLASREIVWQHQGRNPLGVQFSPVTHWIGVTSGDLGLATNSYARVIDWTTGQEVFRVGPQADFEAFSPDGKLALITRRKEIGTEIWELTTGKVLKTIPGSNASLTVSPDGKMFAAAWPARGVFLAHISGSQESVWLNSPAPLGSVLAFSSDGSMLAGASSDQRVRLWNVSELREMGHLLGHVDSVTSVAFSPDGQWLASSGMDHSVLLWPTAAKRAATVISNTWPPYVISPDGSKLAGMVGTDVTRRTELHVWDLTTLRTLILDQSGKPPTPEFFSANSQMLFARGELSTNGTLPLKRWNLNTPRIAPLTTTLNVTHASEVLGTAATPKADLFAVGQRGTDLISLWNPVTGDPMGEWRSLPNVYIGSPYRFAADGMKLVSYALWSDLRILDRSKPQEILTAQLPTTRIQESAFSPDEKILAVACDDHCIHLLDTASLQEVGILRGHQQTVIAVAFSPDGRTLASSGYGGVIKLWSWPARREAASLTQGTKDFCFLAFTPDGNSLIAGGWSRIQIFRVPSLAEIDAQP